MLVYLGLIVLFGLVLAMVSVAISVALALLGRRIFSEARIETIALIAAGFVPALLMLGVAASLFSAEGMSGPAAQGMLIMVGISFLATMIGWPLGYRFSRRMLVRRGG
jgi:hypothetical protein